MPHLISNLVISFAAGALSWSGLEYALHNWVGHLGKGRNAFSREHLRHHAQKDYFAPALKKALFAAPVLSAAALLGSGLLGPAPGLSYTLGLSLAWLGYECLHYRLHAAPPRGPIGRFLRRHHFAHHFQNPWKNHGVTSPLWDLLLGTYLPVTTALQVPRSHALDWLLDEAGEIRPEFAEDYVLRQARVQPQSSGTASMAS